MANKSDPFSLRLSKETDRLISAEARRTKRSKGAVVEALAEEALKTRLIPGIAFRGEHYDRRAWVIGTGLDVWQVIEAHKDFDEDLDRMVRETDLEPAQIRTAVAYYARFPDEIDEFLARNRVSLDELTRQYPHIEVTYVDVD